MYFLTGKITRRVSCMILLTTTTNTQKYLHSVMRVTSVSHQCLLDRIPSSRTENLLPTSKVCTTTIFVINGCNKLKLKMLGCSQMSKSLYYFLRKSIYCSKNRNWKTKIFVLEQDTKAQRRSRGTALLLL